MTKKECKEYDFGDKAEFIDYEKIYYSRFKILKKAFERFEKDEAYDNFIKENAYWLDDYSSIWQSRTVKVESVGMNGKML